MKWTNSGHQLDSLGEQYLKIQRLYLFGTDEKAKKSYDFLCWLGVAEEFDISFVLDITVLNTTIERSFCNRPIVAFQTDLCDQVREAPEKCAVALPWIAQINEREILEGLGLSNIFYLLGSHNRRDNFIQNFVCVWMMYRHKKLISHWTNFVTTSKCNLNCKYCLNFNEYIKSPKDVTFEQFKENIDTLFSKFDYLYSLHFCGGEPMVVKDLVKFIRYIQENYKDRIFEFFIITNGTIVPTEEIISAMKSINGSFLIDDYSATTTAAKVERIKEKLEEQQVGYTINRVDSWFDVDVKKTDNSALSEEELENHKDSCNSYLQEFADKRFYACCYQQYAHRVGLSDLAESDYIDLTTASKMEILEFRQGYTKKGYTSLCQHCRGIGSNAKNVPAAVQVPKKRASDVESSFSAQASGLVSICVPIYNTGKYLDRCIKSLLAQSYQNIEIILIDDGSTDNSLLICEKFSILDSRVVVVHKKNGGEASARNMGLSSAKGDYVMFIDSDDEYLPNAVELLVKGLISWQADLVMGGYLERREDAEHFATGHLRKYSVEEFARIYLHSTCSYDLPYIATTVNGKLFRYDLICQNGIHFDERFVIGNDAVFICEYLKQAKTICDVFAPIYIYYKFHPTERVQGMGWYYPDTFFLFAYVEDKMISLTQASGTEEKQLIAKHYKDLLYGLLNAASNKEHLSDGLLPYLRSLCKEVKLFQLGARLDLEEDYIKKEEGALPIRLLSYLIANNHYGELASLLTLFCKTRGVAPFQGEHIRQMVHLNSSQDVQQKELAEENPLSDVDKLLSEDFHFVEDTLFMEQINELVSISIASRHLADECAIRAGDMEIKSKSAQARTDAAEVKAIEAETRAHAAEAKTVEAEARAHAAEAKTVEAEARAHAAEAKTIEINSVADAYKQEYAQILSSVSWRLTKPVRVLKKLFSKNWS